jgi:hypothetical protein
MLSAAPEFVRNALIAITTTERIARARTRRKMIATMTTTPRMTAGTAEVTVVDAAASESSTDV